MTKAERLATKKLAVAYAAYCSAVAEPASGPRSNAICVWAQSLLDAQRSLGVELRDEISLVNMIGHHQADADAYCALMKSVANRRTA